MNANDDFIIFSFAFFFSSQPKIRRCDRAPKQTIFSIYFEDYLPAGSIGVLKLNFSGHIWENVEGLFKGNYIENNATM